MMDNKSAFAFFILGLITGSLIVVFFFLTLPSPSEISDETYTHYFETIYNTTIIYAGTSEINSIINESSASGNDTHRLNKIADLITDDYNDKIVGNYPYLPNSQRYWYDESGHIRSIPFANDPNTYIATVKRRLEFDPNWLIYQKFGACRELSVIFNHITKKSGFISRIVRTGNHNDAFGTGANHWWNEIELNGINKTFDVQKYLQVKFKMINGTGWSGNRSDFFYNSDSFTPQQLCSWGGVWITDDWGHKIEDITVDYMGSYNCTRQSSPYSMPTAVSLLP